jgi:hypothetical protein
MRSNKDQTNSREQYNAVASSEHTRRVDRGGRSKVCNRLESCPRLEQAHPEVGRQVLVDLELAMQTSMSLGVESSERVSRSVASHHDFGHQLRVEVVLEAREREREAVQSEDNERGRTRYRETDTCAYKNILSGVNVLFSDFEFFAIRRLRVVRSDDTRR